MAKHHFLILICFSTLLVLGFSFSTQKKIPYYLEKPDSTFILPDTLREISGLTFIDDSTFACIQDENGIVFIYDLKQNKIKRQFDFNSNGDYEGIALVKKSLYILQSDGIIYEIEDYTKQSSKISKFITGIPAINNEGLCFDEKNNRLLIACKGKSGKGPEFKDKREIYSFDLTRKKLIDQAVYTFNVQEVKEFAIQNKIQIHATSKKKGELNEPLIKFRTSAIAIHPKTKELYLLSASDFLLFVFQEDGTLISMEQLQENLFNKAEGITFTENGDMLVTNEGQDKKPTLLCFKERV